MSLRVPAALRRKVRARFANCCAYCRTAEALTVVTFEVEHILPRSAGGKTVLENLCLACPTCNRCKAERTAAADTIAGTDVALFHAQRDRWDEHFAWNEDATELIALTPVGRVTIAALKMNRPQLTRVRRMWVAMGENPPDMS